MLRILKHLPKILKDIFLYNFYKRFRNCYYPASILPKLNYVPLINIQSLLDKQTVYIIRRSDKSEEDTFNELGLLRNDALTPKDIPFLSLNILGGRFMPEHSKFRILNEGIKKWNNRKYISLLDHLKDFEILKNYCLVYINANGVDGQEIPYFLQQSNKDIRREVDKFFQHVEKPNLSDGKYELKALSRLIHDPVKLNYWHMELNIFDYQGSSMKYKGSSYQKVLFQQVISDIISVNSNKEVPDYIKIPTKYYKNTIFSC